MAVPLNFRLMGPEISDIVSHSEARAMFVQDELRDRVDSIRSKLTLAS